MGASTLGSKARGDRETSRQLECFQPFARDRSSPSPVLTSNVANDAADLVARPAHYNHLRSTIACGLCLPGIVVGLSRIAALRHSARERGDFGRTRVHDFREDMGTLGCAAVHTLRSDLLPRVLPSCGVVAPPAQRTTAKRRAQLVRFSCELTSP